MKPVIDSLLDHWHATAEGLRDWGATAEARVLDKCADELADALEVGDEEEVSLAQGAVESGYSISHLRRLIAQGKLQDVADTGPPRVRRRDLPRKPGHHLK
jgi:hypothetical protein